jgi:hypothetical protein
VKVLHLPSNIASQNSITVRALRDIGIDARGLIITSRLIRDNQGLEVLPYVNAPMKSLPGILRRIPIWRSVLAAIKWADVVHWHFNSHVMPKDLDLRYAKLLNKARIVEFWGSDIRIPEIASSDNPYIRRMYEENLEPWMSDGHSREEQSRFARFGFECLVPGVELLSYIQRNKFPSPYRTMARLILSDFQVNYPDPHKSKPLIVHAPSKKTVKGTDAVLRAIEQLKSKYEFDFQLIHDVEHSKAMDIIRICDIMLDQFVIGAHGMVALEAMAFGKPTVCYIKSSLSPKYPDLPIVNANQENLAEVIGSLLANGQRRYEIGLRSRAYVEKYHDAHKIARQLVAIYEELLEKVRK